MLRGLIGVAREAAIMDLKKTNSPVVIMLRFTGAILSGFMLFTAFPPLEIAPFAWAALVPILLVCASCPPAESFKWGLLSGIVFWLMSISWVTHVTFAGWIFLSLYCALYIAIFSHAASWWIRRRGVRSGIGNPAVLFIIPVLWTGIEFARSVVGGGFPWNQLGVSQYNSLALIQCAEWGGVYLVSFNVAIVNTALALTLLQYWRTRQSAQRKPHPELIISMTILALSFWQGNDAMRRFQSRSGTITVAAVQPNVRQMDKWSEEAIQDNFNRIRSATVKAITESRPDLVVWPETVVSDFVRYDGTARDLVDEMLAGATPLLVGSMDYDESGAGPNYYNGSFLFMPDGAQPQFYHKQHLVLFGEYIPFEGIIPFIRSLTPIEGSFTAGRESTVFKLGDTGVRFSALICFEDTVARVARMAVRSGARLLINQTNDAWFDPSSASRQQMTHCVFRCVENRVAAVRATNTGLTCFIDRNGQIYGSIETMGAYSSAPAYSTKAVFVPDAGMSLTFYTRYGDIFALACLSATILILALYMLDTIRSNRYSDTNIKVDI